MAPPDLSRLQHAVHFCTPPVICLVLVNSLLAEKVFKIFKLLGNLVPSRALRCLRQLYVLCNAAAVTTAAAAVLLRCDLHDPTTPLVSDLQCFPVVSLVAVALVVALFTDRAVLNFLHAPSAGGSIQKRAARGTVLAAVFMGLSDKNDSLILPLLLLAASNRSSGSIRVADRGIGLAARVVAASAAVHDAAFVAVGLRRSSVLCLLCAILGR